MQNKMHDLILLLSSKYFVKQEGVNILSVICYEFNKFEAKELNYILSLNLELKEEFQLLNNSTQYVLIIKD